MPNLVGLRDGPSPLSVEDQAKEDTLKAMQMEALGLQRRDHLSTTDFKENKASYIPTKQLESQRIVNKSRIGKGEKSKLDGWNNAWTGLQDDGTDAQNLQAVNEGLGQTHRAKLMSDDSIRKYTGEENFRRRGHDFGSGRADRGARGGGNVGRAIRGGGGKAKGVRRVTFQNEVLIQPLTRVRGPKGNSTPQSDFPRRHPVPILKTAPAVKQPTGNVTTLSAPAASVRQPLRNEWVLAEPSAFMASSGIRKEQNGEKAKDKAPTHNIDSAMKTTSSISNEKAAAPKPHADTDISSSKTTTAADKLTMSVSSRPKADLMDLDIDQETTQPVLPFTASKVGEELAHRVLKAPSFDDQIELLIKGGRLSPTQLKELKSIQANVHVRDNANTLVSEAPRPETHTKSELVSLHPKATAPKVLSGIARKFAEQQDAFLIGEHVYKDVYKSRYHHTTLTEDFKRLKISDPTPVEVTAASLPNIGNPDKKPISVEKEKSMTNPFGPPPDKGKGPSLPPHLLAQATTTDHGAAARSQYLGIGPLADKGKEHSLPIHLSAQVTTTDRGATARNPCSGDNGILSSMSNQQSLEDVIPSIRPARRNMINHSGFYALVENRNNPVAAGQNGEDPLLVVRRRGL